MKEVTIAEVQDNLPEYLELAENEEILIVDQGKPAGMLVKFQSDQDVSDYQFESDPRFLRRVSEARQRLRAGQGVRLEDVNWD